MVKITLPNPNDYQYAGGVKYFLRQFELCIHHAQKAYEELEQDEFGEMNDEEKKNAMENMMLVYRFPEMNLIEENGYLKIDNLDAESDEMQNLQLEFGLI